MHSKLDLRDAAAALALAALLLVPRLAIAGSSSLPPDVDLDPDRGMSFGRLPKTSFDRRVFDSTKKSLTSQAMDPTIDPYNPVVRPSRYEPGTGKIRDSYTDKLREIRRHEEAARKARARKSDDATTAAARAYKPNFKSTRSTAPAKTDD